VRFYLRKRLNLSPVCLNLSKSGLGVSVGIPGLRIGKGPRGTYVHAGRQGLYDQRGLPGHVQHHGELTPQEMTPLGGLVILGIVLGLILAMALGILILASSALAGEVTCHTSNDMELNRLVTTCSDGSRSVTQYDRDLDRWDTQIITPPKKTNKPPAGWPAPGKSPR
jgi:hypothetical protein